MAGKRGRQINLLLKFMDLMKMQLEKYLEWYNEGKIKGVILCSNCIADIGLDTVDYTREWLLKH